MKTDLLYITFINLYDTATTGSSVRPKKMLEAFETLGLSVKIMQGMNNNVRYRHQQAKEILHWLKNNKPEMCYIEPPSGPFFCPTDLRVLKRLKKMEIPTALFYRDAYWLFEDYNGAVAREKLSLRIKKQIIKYMQKRDLHVFYDSVDCLFFPSKMMAGYFDFRNKKILPPGCVYRGNEQINDECETIRHKKILTCIYVGGASLRYGTRILMEAFKKLNKDKLRVKLTLVCPKAQWDNEQEFLNIESKDYEWLQLHHVNGDEKLEALYKEADFSIVPLLRTSYNEFAIPIKLFEYISYNKPIIGTNCKEMEQLIKRLECGWIVEDSSAEITKKIEEILENRELLCEKKVLCRKAMEENTWTKRAEQVIRELKP